MPFQVVSVKYDVQCAWWVVIKYLTDTQGNGLGFDMHTIADEAVVGWPLALRATDENVVLDALLHAPMVGKVDLAELDKVKAAHAPKTKLHTAALKRIAEDRGLAPEFHPTQDDPLAALREAIKKGIRDGKVREILGGTVSRPSSGSPRPGLRQRGRGHHDGGVVDDRRPLPTGRFRRIVAGEQTDHG